MRSLHSVLLLLTTVTPFLACTYKAEPVDGKQACAVGPQVCPDGYVCSVGFCYHSGVQPGGSEGGSRGGLPVTGGAVSFGGGGGMGGTRIVGTGGIGGEIAATLSERLADYLLARLCGGGTVPALTPSARLALADYHYPGNVREL